MRNHTKLNGGHGLYYTAASIVSEVKMEVGSCFISHSSLPCETDMLPLHRDIHRVPCLPFCTRDSTWPLFKPSRRKQTITGAKHCSGLVTGYIFSRGDPVYPSKTSHKWDILQRFVR